MVNRGNTHAVNHDLLKANRRVSRVRNYIVVVDEATKFYKCVDKEAKVVQPLRMTWELDLTNG